MAPPERIVALSYTDHIVSVGVHEFDNVLNFLSGELVVDFGVLPLSVKIFQLLRARAQSCSVKKCKPFDGVLNERFLVWGVRHSPR